MNRGHIEKFNTIQCDGLWILAYEKSILLLLVTARAVLFDRGCC